MNSCDDFFDCDSVGSGSDRDDIDSYESSISDNYKSEEGTNDYYELDAEYGSDSDNS